MPTQDRRSFLKKAGLGAAAAAAWQSPPGALRAAGANERIQVAVGRSLKIAFKPEGGIAWDPWFARGKDGVYHAYYGYHPGVVNFPHMTDWSVGHAVSKDLLNWTDQGTVVRAERGTWNDTCISTGSVIEFNGRWAMLYGGESNDPAKRGIGLAWSDDLYKWNKHGDAPVLNVRGGDYEMHDEYGDPGRLAWSGDPYLFRVPDEPDFLYAIVNARVSAGPLDQRGAVAPVRSRNMVDWEILPPLCHPGLFTKMETAQIWQRDGRWYIMSHSGPTHQSAAFVARYPAEIRTYGAAFVFTAEAFRGPYRLAGHWWVWPPPQPHCYVGKVLEGPDRKDVVITFCFGGTKAGQITGLSEAIPVTYPVEGGVRADLAASTTPPLRRKGPGRT